MDLETENRIASILLKEAAELRRQSEREGVLAYLQKPNVRGRPNSRFLTATVLGVQQANRAVEVNEMWRIRRKEQELEDRLAGRRSKDVRNSDRSSRNIGESSGGARKEAADCVKNARAGSLSDRIIDDSCSSMEYGGPRDGELQDFLLSKAKRGRGSVGPRMDEAGPYLAHPGSKRRLSLSPESWVQGKQEPRKILAPEKPVSLKCDESSEDESGRDRKKKAKKSKSGNSKKQHSRKHTSKEKSRDRKRKRKDKRSKY